MRIQSLVKIWIVIKTIQILGKSIWTCSRQKGWCSMLSAARRTAQIPIALSLTWALITAPALWSQGAASASLRGIVRDGSNAEVPGARVTLTDPEKGVSRTLTTTANGEDNFARLAPGKYGIRGEQAGFAA